jgi:aminoglycoside 2'-N-acetyltransferase I
MTIEIAEADALSDDVLAELRALSRAVYPPDVPATDPGRQITWVSPQRRILVRDDEGRLVSHVGILTRVGMHNEQTVRIGGIGGVLTHPSARGQGYASAGIQKAVAVLTKNNGVDFVLLVCLPPLVPFYARLGWRQFPGSLLVRQPGANGAVPFTVNEPMVISATEQEPEAGTIDLCGYPW